MNPKASGKGKKALEKVQSEITPPVAPKGRKIVRKKVREVYEI